VGVCFDVSGQMDYFGCQIAIILLASYVLGMEMAALLCSVQ